MRIDSYLVKINKFSSRTKAKEAVERGEVFVNGKTVKPSYDVIGDEQVTLSSEAGLFVSNGAFKLKRAIEYFALDLKDKTAADIGASTGGFTQCLLMNGASKVFAVDVGESLLHPSVSSDKRVTVLDNTNARFLTEKDLGERVDVVVSDVSFISLTYILPAINGILKDDGECVVLVKPQFECGPSKISKNGIVTDRKARADACLNISAFANSSGLGTVGFTYAPIREGKNVEFLLYLKKNKPSTVTSADIKSVCINN